MKKKVSLLAAVVFVFISTILIGCNKEAKNPNVKKENDFALNKNFEFTLDNIDFDGTLKCPENYYPLAEDDAIRFFKDKEGDSESNLWDFIVHIDKADREKYLDTIDDFERIIKPETINGVLLFKGNGDGDHLGDSNVLFKYIEEKNILLRANIRNTESTSGIIELLNSVEFKRKNSLNPQNTYFSVFDIDGDGKDNLLLLENTKISVYTYGEKIEKIGENDFLTGTVRFLKSENKNYPGMFYFTTGGGYNHYGYMTVVNGNLAMEKIFDVNYGFENEQEEIYYTDDKRLIAEAKALYDSDKDIKFEEALISDINFDGYFDLLLPYESPASSINFQGFVWNNKTRYFIEAPIFKELPNFSADKENKMILTHRTASMITSYCMYKYSEDKNDFYITNSLYWEPCSDDKFMHLVEESYDIKGNRKILNDVKVKSLNPIDIDPKDSNAAPYFKENSFWNLNGEKWKWKFKNKSIFNAAF